MFSIPGYVGPEALLDGRVAPLAWLPEQGGWVSATGPAFSGRTPGTGGSRCDSGWAWMGPAAVRAAWPARPIDCEPGDNLDTNELGAFQA